MNPQLVCLKAASSRQQASCCNMVLTTPPPPPTSINMNLLVSKNAEKTRNLCFRCEKLNCLQTSTAHLYMSFQEKFTHTQLLTYGIVASNLGILLLWRSGVAARFLSKYMLSDIYGKLSYYLEGSVLLVKWV